MSEFQAMAYKTKKSDKRYWAILCVFFFLLLPMAIHQREILQIIVFGAVALTCIIYLIVQHFKPKEKIKISSEAIQLCYLTKTQTIKLSNIDKVNYECFCSYKRHVPTYESYGSLIIQVGGKKHYITEIENVKGVYDVITNYINNLLEKR